MKNPHLLVFAWYSGSQDELSAVKIVKWFLNAWGIGCSGRGRIFVSEVATSCGWTSNTSPYCLPCNGLQAKLGEGNTDSTCKGLSRMFTGII